MSPASADLFQASAIVQKKEFLEKSLENAEDGIGAVGGALNTLTGSRTSYMEAQKMSKLVSMIFMLHTEFLSVDCFNKRKKPIHSHSQTHRTREA